MISKIFPIVFAVLVVAVEVNSEIPCITSKMNVKGTPLEFVWKMEGLRSHYPVAKTFGVGKLELTRRVIFEKAINGKANLTMIVDLTLGDNIFSSVQFLGGQEESRPEGELRYHGEMMVGPGDGNRTSLGVVNVNGDHNPYEALFRFGFLDRLHFERAARLDGEINDNILFVSETPEKEPIEIVYKFKRFEIFSPIKGELQEFCK